MSQSPRQQPAGMNDILQGLFNPHPSHETSLKRTRRCPAPLHRLCLRSGGDDRQRGLGSRNRREGEAIRFIVTEGGPHNVVFDGQDLPSEVQTRLDRQISDRTAPLTSGMLSEAGEAVTVSFAGIPAGRYSFSCATHAAAGMKGTITVR